MHNCTLTYILLVIYLYTVTGKSFWMSSLADVLVILLKVQSVALVTPANAFVFWQNSLTLKFSFTLPRCLCIPKKLLQWILAKFLTQETFHTRQSE